MAKSFHMHLDVRGAPTKWPLKDFRKMFRHQTENRSMTPHEAKAYLLQVLSEGYEFIPYGNCDNFDPKQGCLGHEEKWEPIV